MPPKSSSTHLAISQPFGSLISDEHLATLLSLLNKARRRKGGCNLSNTDCAVLRGRLEEQAALFLLFDRHLRSGETPTSKKAALERIESAAHRLMTALGNIDRSSWLSIYMHFRDPPRGFAEAVSRFAMGGVEAETQELYKYFRLVAQIGEAAGKAKDAILNARSTRKKYSAVRWLVSGSSDNLASLYFEATDRPATAFYSENYAKSPLGKRASPFVRFVAEFIRPFTPELCTQGLGEAVYSALPKRGSQKRK